MAAVMIVMSVNCFAADKTDVNTADALNELGLFLGTGNGYELDNGLTRAQGVTLLVRMIGKEEAALKGEYKNAFNDVPDWAKGYVGYAFENGITNGTSDVTFSSNVAMTDYMFLTLVLRALNYSDKGDAPLFVWDNPYALAYALDLIDTVTPDANFTRADAIKVFWNALDVKLNGVKTALADRLVEQKVFSAEELAEARDIQLNGRKENAGVPIVPTPDTEAPNTEVLDTEVTETEEPEIEAPEIETPELDIPEYVEPETTVPEPTAPEPAAPETTAPETTAPENDGNSRDELGDGGLPVAP